MSENFRNDKFELMKEKWDCLLEEVGAYKIERKKLVKTVLEKNVAMKAIKRSVVDMERTQKDRGRRRDCFLLIADEYERPSHQKQVSETSSVLVFTICF